MGREPSASPVASQASGAAWTTACLAKISCEHGERLTPHKSLLKSRQAEDGVWAGASRIAKDCQLCLFLWLLLTHWLHRREIQSFVLSLGELESG